MRFHFYCALAVISIFSTSFDTNQKSFTFMAPTGAQGGAMLSVRASVTFLKRTRKMSSSEHLNFSAYSNQTMYSVPDLAF